MVRWRSIKIEDFTEAFTPKPPETIKSRRKMSFIFIRSLEEGTISFFDCTLIKVALILIQQDIALQIITKKRWSSIYRIKRSSFMFFSNVDHGLSIANKPTPRSTDFHLTYYCVCSHWISRTCKRFGSMADSPRSDSPYRGR